MKKLLLLVTTVAFLSNQTILSQVEVIDYNGISAHVHARGLLFNNFSSPGFEYPKGSGKNLIFSMADWYAGVDVNGGLKMAASEGYDFFGSDQIGDFSAGPLTVTPGTGGGGSLDYGAASTDALTMLVWNNVWVVRKAEIDSFIDWSTNTPNWPGYTVPNSILDWPAHGDVSQFQPFYLAPFVDTDTDGIYNPNAGDYPDIKGDFCAFTIYNDKGGIHQTSGADPIGLEIHQMVYGYILDPFCSYHDPLNATLFIDRRIINRSTQVLYDFSMGIFVDPDLGNGSDDFIGCDVDRSMMYVYNGDALDEGATGYGSDIPALGIVILKGIDQDQNGLDDAVGIGANESINGTGYGNGIIDDEILGMTGFTYVFGSNGLTNLNSAADRFNLINGNYTDGTPFMDPNGATSFMYPDDSNPLGYLQGGTPYASWEEAGTGNAPSDRKMLATSGSNVLMPGEYYDVTLAVVVSPFMPDGNGSIEALQLRVDSIRSVYELAVDPCTGVGVEELNKENIYLYPNPANSLLTIDGITPQTEISVYDTFGRLVISTSNKKSINVAYLKSGIYLIQLNNNGSLITKRFVKE